VQWYLKQHCPSNILSEEQKQELLVKARELNVPTKEANDIVVSSVCGRFAYPERAYGYCILNAWRSQRWRLLVVSRYKIEILPFRA